MPAPGNTTRRPAHEVILQHLEVAFRKRGTHGRLHADALFRILREMTIPSSALDTTLRQLRALHAQHPDLGAPLAEIIRNLEHELAAVQ